MSENQGKQGTKPEPEKAPEAEDKQKTKPAELTEAELDKVVGGQMTPVRNLRG